MLHPQEALQGTFASGQTTSIADDLGLIGCGAANLAGSNFDDASPAIPAGSGHGGLVYLEERAIARPVSS